MYIIKTHRVQACNYYIKYKTMAKCDFSIDFTGASDTLIEKASTAIGNAGGIFNGNTDGGNFSISTPIGKIAGEYNVLGQVINFAITDKPFLLSCSRIEEELRKYIE
ncbi:MAG TPA: hypothetical protein VNI52_11930 [Sphingobacteriaceae bacterium]|nr:hypothetical protein [Sphingobacteriaceae bacterium]